MARFILDPNRSTFAVGGGAFPNSGTIFSHFPRVPALVPGGAIPEGSTLHLACADAVSHMAERHRTWPGLFTYIHYHVTGTCLV
jgi:hypothetical protein